MTHAIIIKGRVTGPRSIEVDEPLHAEEVEVIVRPRSQAGQDIVEFLKGLPPGTRSKEDIDRQIREERSSWGDR